MDEYNFKKFENAKYYALVSLLDYRKDISDQLVNIELKDVKNKEILVDTALVSGMNEYRFLSIKTNEKGELDLSTYKYIVPDKEIVKLSNGVLSSYKNYVEHSVLSSFQIKTLLTEQY